MTLPLAWLCRQCELDGKSCATGCIRPQSYSELCYCWREELVYFFHLLPAGTASTTGTALLRIHSHRLTCLHGGMRLQGLMMFCCHSACLPPPLLSFPLGSSIQPLPGTLSEDLYKNYNGFSAMCVSPSSLTSAHLCLSCFYPYNRAISTKTLRNHVHALLPKVLIVSPGQATPYSSRAMGLLWDLVVAAGGQTVCNLQ